jgi:type IV secretory pathway TraG/TraD family ATPase VirD4
MLFGQDDQHEAGLQRLAGLDLARNWLDAHANGWDQTAIQRLAVEAEAEGCGSLPLEAVHRCMVQLRDFTDNDGRRTRRRTGATLPETQTVSRLATAEWADLKDFTERYAFEKGDLWLNRDPASGKALGIQPGMHMGVFCQTGGGKGVSFIIPQHAMWPGSLVSIDPSGENATIAAMHRGDGRDDEGVLHCMGRGQATHVLDPLHAAPDLPKKYRKRFNPLDALDPAEPKFIEKAAALADALVVRPETENEPVWNNKARTLIKGLILHIKTAPFFHGRRNLVTLRDLATMGDVELAELTEKHTGTKTDPWVALFDAMLENKACGNVIPAIGSEFLNLVAKDIDKQWHGIQSALTDQTEFLESQLIQDCLTSSDFELKDLKEHPDGCSLFLCLPEGDMDTYKGWVRMMLYLIDYEVRRTRGNGATGKPILMLVDEFAVLGTMKRIGQGLTNIRKYGLQYILICQSIPQLKEAYPQSWETILGALGVKLFSVIEDKTTAEWVSWRCGETDLVLTTESLSLARSEQRTEGTSSGTSESKGGSKSSSFTTGSSQTATQGQSSSFGKSNTNTRTFGSSSSEAFGVNSGFSRGGGSSQSHSNGSSDSTGYKDNKWFRGIPEAFHIMREDPTRTKGTNHSATSGTSTNYNESNGQSRTHTSGQNQSQSSASGNTVTHGQSASTSETTQQSSSYSSGETWNSGRSQSTNQSTTAGQTQTFGQSQSHHKRPLLSPDDAMLFFSTGQPGDLYDGGLGLLLVKGERPMVVERTAFFADPAFDGRWCYNAAYPDTRPPNLNRMWDLGFVMENTGPLWEGGKAPLIGRWFKAPGEQVGRGEPICEVLPGPTVAGYIDDRLNVNAPVSGRVVSIERGEGSLFEGGVVLASIEYNLAEQKV